MTYNSKINPSPNLKKQNWQLNSSEPFPIVLRILQDVCQQNINPLPEILINFQSNATSPNIEKEGFAPYRSSNNDYSDLTPTSRAVKG